MTEDIEDLRAVLCRAFPDHDPAPVLDALLGYGSARHHHEAPRVRRAIVQLCAGDATRLSHYLDIAKTDYRDVLAWASQPPPTAAEAAADLAAARALLERWGKH